jgi:glycosyltransferase involved in cell wall biosynthesis
VHVPRRFVAEEWGGTETVLLEISRQQQCAGWLPEVFTTKALAPRQSETIGGVPVRRFSYFYPYLGLSAADRRQLDKKGGNPVSLSLLRALLGAKDVRLFHAHTLGRLGGEVRTAARRRGVPYVVSIHGGAFDYPAGEIADLLRPVQGKLDWGKPFGALFGARRVLLDADQVICVGQAGRDAALKSLPHDRVAYLPNGVDADKFSRGDGPAFRRKHGIPAEAFVVLNVSRLDSQKNQLALVQAFARLRARRPECRLVLVGPETQRDYAAKVRATIADLGLAGSVKILSGLRHDDPDLVNAYHACDVFVLPSVHEPFGIVVLEAWCARRAVVASRVGGLCALVEPGRTGLGFDPNAADAVEQLAAALDQLAAQPALRTQLGEAGSREVQARYEWPAINQRLEEIYQTAGRHAGSRS